MLKLTRHKAYLDDKTTYYIGVEVSTRITFPRWVPKTQDFTTLYDQALPTTNTRKPDIVSVDGYASLRSLVYLRSKTPGVRRLRALLNDGVSTTVEDPTEIGGGWPALYSDVHSGMLLIQQDWFVLFRDIISEQINRFDGIRDKYNNNTLEECIGRYLKTVLLGASSYTTNEMYSYHLTVARNFLAACPKDVNAIREAPLSTKFPPPHSIFIGFPRLFTPPKAPLPDLFQTFCGTNVQLKFLKG